MPKSRVNRRSVVKGLALGGVAAVAAPGVIARAQTTIRINAGMLPIVNGPVYIAIREKYFEKLGLDVNLIKFTSGPAQFAALAGEQVHLGWGGMGAYLLAKANGQDLNFVSVFMDYNRLQALVVPKDSPVKGVKDLQGRKIGVVQGSDPHFGLLKALQKNGMQKASVEVVNMAPTQQVAAFQAGNVDAVYVWEPFVTPLLQAGARAITRMSELDPGSSFLGWAGRKPWLEKNSDAMVRLLRGWNMGLEKMKSDTEMAVRYTLDFTGMAREQADTIVKDLVHFEATAALDPKSPAYWAKGSKLHGVMTDYLAFGKEYGLTQNTIDIDGYVLPQFMQAVRKG
ncbi:MAG: transporter substrate-binding domain-containing protein [Hyphomicrobiaceae bacterium]|nr:MAG: transporter substrate-binding domain-containing protein [Hyphomicrobiaceae bacterium]